MPAHKCCKHNYMVPFGSLLGFFCPQIKTWSITCLLYTIEMWSRNFYYSRNVMIFSSVYLRPGYSGDQVNSMAKQEKAISRMYGQGLNYHIERKWSQGYKYERQICSGIAASLQLLGTPRAFSATRPGNQELLETPYLPNFSPISMYPCIPVVVPASGAGDLFFIQ